MTKNNPFDYSYKMQYYEGLNLHLKI